MKTFIPVICFFFFVLFTQPTHANPVDPCQSGTNLIENGDFSDFFYLGVIRDLTDFFPGFVDDWSGSYGYANIEGLNNTYAELSLALDINTQTPIGTDIFQSVTFETGKTYRLKARVASNQVVGGELIIALVEGLTPVGGINSPPTATSMQTVYSGLSESFDAYPNSPWTDLDFHFVADGNFNQLWIHLAPLNNENAIVYLDDICLGEENCNAYDSINIPYQVSCANAGTEIEVSVPAGSPALYLYETDGSCNASNISSSCMTFPPLEASAGGAYTFTVPNQANYVLEWRDPQGCPRRDLITPSSTVEINISHLEGDICEGDAFIEIPAGIPYYVVNIYEIDPATNQSNLACYLTQGQNTGPTLLDILQACPDVVCDSWDVYRFDLSYYDDCGVFHTESVKSRIFCRPELEVTANPDPICAGQPVTYSLTNPNNGITQWYVNGVPEGTGGPFFTTTIDINDVVAVLHLTPQGCIGGLTTDFKVKTCLPPCEADFAALGLQNQFAFSDQSTTVSTDYIISWHWDFGDGNVSTLQNPIHIYPLLNATYTVTLSITTHEGCASTYSEQITVVRGNVRRLGQESEAFHVFPNPANDFVTLNYPAGLTGHVQLIDLTGRLVKEAQLTPAQESIRFSTGELTNGIYLLQLKSQEQHIFQQKVVIQH